MMNAMKKCGKQLYSDYERAILDEWSGKASQKMWHLSRDTSLCFNWLVIPPGTTC